MATEEADPARLELPVHLGEQVGGLGDARVAVDEARALLQHLVAPVEKAPARANEARRIDLHDQGVAQVPVQLDHGVAEAKAIREIEVDGPGKRDQVGEARREGGRGLKAASFLVDIFRIVRPQNSEDERQAQENEDDDPVEAARMRQARGGADGSRSLRFSAEAASIVGRRLGHRP